jgi:hypothetical protein
MQIESTGPWAYRHMVIGITKTYIKEIAAHFDKGNTG